MSTAPARGPNGSQTARRPARRRPTTVLTYGGLLLAAVVGFASHEWGATAHSLVGIAVIGLIAWHVLSKRRWVASAARRRSTHPERNLVHYNAVLAVDFVVVNLSGFPVWIWDVDGVLASVHQVTGIAFVPLVLGHLVLNRRRLLARLRGPRPAHSSTT